MLRLLIYTIIGLQFFLLFDIYEKMMPKRMASYLQARLDIMMWRYFIVGYVGITFYYWRKVWSYLEEVLDGMKVLRKKDNAVVKLSPPLGEMEKQMNEIKMEMLSANRAVDLAEQKKNEMVTYLAHDIRTPLTSMIGYLSIMKDMPDMPEKKRMEFVDAVFDKSLHLEQLVNQFFEITQYNMQKISIKKQDIPLEYLLVQLTDEFYPMIEEKGNTVKLDVEKDMVCYIDPEKMSRVFGNLLKNALNYSYPKTEITIQAKSVQKKKERRDIIVFCNEGDDISKEQLNTIFQKFVRLDEARTSDGSGTGLGLSIAREIVLLHGGNIWAESQGGKIQFFVEIPSMEAK